MELKAGQRFLLTDTKKYWRLLEGSVEAYSIITDDRQFRQLFIASIKDEGAVFPLNGSYGIGTQIYAVSDTVWEEVDISNDLSDRELKDADIWFGKLFEESALCKNLYLGDSHIISFFERWKQIPDGKTKGSLVIEIMSYISECVSRHFSEEDDRYNKQLEHSRKIQHDIVEEAIGTLLTEDIIIHAQDGMGDDVQNDVAFIVRQAGRKLHLPETELTILPAVAAKLDLLGLLRRMTQKANISIRLISLEPDWNKKDSGVIIGYYGENKELSLLWPTEPGKYNILNKRNFRHCCRIQEDYSMSTPHNEASINGIAKTVLMPGDPRRSEFIAETFLEHRKLVNEKNEAGMCWADYAANGRIGAAKKNPAKNTTWAAEYVYEGVDLAKRQLLTIEPGTGLMLLVR